jgi:uncharacterized membrane protein
MSSVSEDIKSERILSLDALRGLIMILMALDHANSFLSFGYSSEFWGGPLRQFDGSADFLIRFITHICAPGFFFLMGISMIYLMQSRRSQNWPDSRIRRYFLTRGTVIVVIHFALGLILAAPRILRGDFGITINVLFILGLSMLICAFLIKMKWSVLLLLAAGCFILPELILGRFVQFGQIMNPFLQLLLVPGSMGSSRVFYTLFPWIGFTIVGLAFGILLYQDRHKTISRVPLLSATGFIIFLILRMAGGFGNLRPMEGAGWIAFLQLTKYPPSIVFSLFMLSVNLILLYLLERFSPLIEKHGHVLIVFGRSALFFYILHHFIYLTMMIIGFRNLILPRMLLKSLIFGGDTRNRTGE